ncbi:MAG: DUF1934 domain-containing protein [Clostridia bacterium]|nr:DUF1934 domain-containing protein [Clostridia bacterium]
MKCKIKVTTRQSESGGISLFDNAFFGNEPVYEFDPYNGLSPDDIDTITTYFDGLIAETGDEVRITYFEDDASGMGGVKAIIAFNKSEPKEVTITRSGAVNTIMLFSQGERTISVYNTPYMPFELGIYAKRVDNRIMTDGVLEISYILEIKGALAQKTEMKLELTRE